jgi:hypothetical protein
MGYIVEAKETSDSMELEDEDWRYLLHQANSSSQNPEVGRLEGQYATHPPEVISDSVSQDLAETLSRLVPDLPAESKSVLDPPPVPGAASTLHMQNYFGGERKAIVEEFIRLCEQGELRVRRTP